MSLLDLEVGFYFKDGTKLDAHIISETSVAYYVRADDGPKRVAKSSIKYTVKRN